MKKLLIIVVALAFLNVPGVAQAQEVKGVTPADLAAVATYRQAIEKVKDETKAARLEIRKKNTGLAQALGKLGDDYTDKAVTAAHRELLDAQRKLAAVELASYLVYKKYAPDWMPATGGAPVSISDKKSSKKGDKADSPKK